MGDVTYSNTYEIATAQLAVDGQIEHGQISDRMGILKINPNCPNVLWLERRLLSDKLALVPSHTHRKVFHYRLLGC